MHSLLLLLPAMVASQRAEVPFAGGHAMFLVPGERAPSCSTRRATTACVDATYLL
jgi:hypothetical protein